MKTLTMMTMMMRRFDMSLISDVMCDFEKAEGDISCRDRVSEALTRLCSKFNVFDDSYLYALCNWYLHFRKNKLKDAWVAESTIELYFYRHLPLDNTFELLSDAWEYAYEPEEYKEVLMLSNKIFRLAREVVFDDNDENDLIEAKKYLERIVQLGKNLSGITFKYRHLNDDLSTYYKYEVDECEKDVETLKTGNIFGQTSSRLNVFMENLGRQPDMAFGDTSSIFKSERPLSGLYSSNQMPFDFSPLSDKPFDYSSDDFTKAASKPRSEVYSKVCSSVDDCTTDLMSEEDDYSDDNEEDEDDYSDDEDDYSFDEDDEDSVIPEDLPFK